MFLRNFDNAMIYASGLPENGGDGTVAPTAGYITTDRNFYGNTNGTSNFGDGYLNFKKTDGSIGDIKIARAYYSGYFGSFLLSLDNYHICLGNGSTAVTYDDYKLSGSTILNKLVQVGNKSLTYNISAKTWTKTATFTYTNTTSDSITISEWGLCLGASSNDYQYSQDVSLPFNNNSSNYVIYYREVLQTPITIDSGNTATLTFSINFPMMTQP